MRLWDCKTAFWLDMAVIGLIALGIVIGGLTADPLAGPVG